MTAHIRNLFGIVGGGASGVLTALAVAHLATPLTVGICVAVIAACVIGIFGCKAVEKDGRRKVEMLPWQQLGPRQLRPLPSRCSYQESERPQ